MEPTYWEKRWEDKHIPFHEKDGNKLLARYIDDFALADGARVFLPLCGKTRDIHFLLSRGYRVVGIEWVESAVQELFVDLGVELKISVVGPLKLYQAESLDIYVGDFYDLTPDIMGAVDVIYDRAALVAFPADMRDRYVNYLMELTAKAQQFLVTFDYIQADMDGPPFSIGEGGVARHYEEHYDIKLIRRIDIPGGLKQIVKSDECVFFLKPR